MKYKIFKNSCLYLLLIAGVISGTSCKKEFAEPKVDGTPVAYAAVHNFALLTTGSSSVFVSDTLFKVANANATVGYGGTLFGNYFGVTPGEVKVGLRTATGTANYASRTVNLARNTNTSFFAYDTLTTGGSAKLLVLNNDMRAADTSMSNFRFLNLSPNAGPVNVILTRTANQFNIAATGTVNLASIPFVGATATPNEATLSVFSSIAAGTYTVTIQSGTITILTQTNVILRERKNYSIVLRGFTSARTSIPAGQTLGLSLLLHNL
jgi:hypothetical protein